jgi:hypothetical protein
MTITQKADGCNKASDPTKNNLPFFQSYGSIFAPCHLHRPGIITRSFREITVGSQIHKELDIRLNITGLTDLSEAEVC